MKLLLFAHKPPPHHGQSFMVRMLLDALGGDQRNGRQAHPEAHPTPIQCYHVDCRLSDDLQDIGRARLGKLVLLIKYCLEAVYCRFRYGATSFLYCPAPGMKAPVYRDWIVMAICRPFFKQRIYYWHAVGLAEWLKGQARPWERWLTQRLLGKPQLSIVLSRLASGDPQYLQGARIEVVPNGIADPCPDFHRKLSPTREKRAAARRALIEASPDRQAGPAATGTPLFYELLFLSLCVRDKGIFDALEAVAMANRRLAEAGLELRVRLNVAGKFMYPAEQEEFNARIAAADLQWARGPLVRYHGFVAAEEKDRLFRECDCFLFPTYYLAEGAPVALLEAMAYGVEVVTTRWRALPELLPPGHPWLGEPQAPAQLAEQICALVGCPPNRLLRPHFLANYTEARWLERVRAALLCHG